MFSFLPPTAANGSVEEGDKPVGGHEAQPIGYQW
jgi:hypothetical protein